MRQQFRNFAEGAGNRSYIQLVTLSPWRRTVLNGGVMHMMTKLFPRVLAATVGLFLTGCAATADRDPSDPFEPINRRVFAFNDAVDRNVVVPVTSAYVAVTADPIQQGVNNAFRNIGEPAVFANQVLQGKPKGAAITFWRFGINSTVGLAGLIDVATRVGLDRANEDLGQTLAVWGVPSGPYLVLPVIGGSTIRDRVGSTLSIPATPAFWIDDTETVLAVQSIAFLNASAQLLDARSAITGDRYLLVRDAYLQRREFLAKDGAATAEDPFLDD